MGESDVYCAFCSGPMRESSIKFTKRQTNAPKRNADYEETNSVKSVRTDTDHLYDEESIESTDREDDLSDSEDDLTSCYSPDVLPPESTEWIGVCRCLALNMDRIEFDGTRKAFLSGHGSPDCLGYFMVHQRGTDPNDTEALEHPCYDPFNPGDTAAFPLHDACLETFTRSLGLRDMEVNLNILYDVMKSHMPASDMLRHLGLDYIYLKGAGQFWECCSGLEYCVADPSPASRLTHIILDSMPKDLLSTKSPTFDFSHKVHDDKLDALPYNVVYNVFKYLDIKDTLALRQASWHVFNQTRSDTKRFGKQMVQLHLSPWFWEVDDLVSSIDDPAFNFTRFFLWLKAATEPKVGMSGAFLGVANRWRIWNTCQQLMLDYQERASARR